MNDQMMMTVIFNSDIEHIGLNKRTGQHIDAKYIRMVSDELTKGCQHSPSWFSPDVPRQPLIQILV